MHAMSPLWHVASGGSSWDGLSLELCDPTVQLCTNLLGSFLGHLKQIPENMAQGNLEAIRKVLQLL